MGTYLRSSSYIRKPLLIYDIYEENFIFFLSVHLQVSEEDRETRDLVQTDVHVREPNFVALQVEMREKKGE
jgi:hypothetical protein